MNDPNGLVYVDGVYHLFFQYNPEGSDWGNMSWGHATSPDLVTWTEHDVAIPRDADEGVFSGSVVVDETNSSGFGVDGRAPLVAMYTSDYTPTSRRAGTQAQSLAYSNDGGYTWTKHRGNPVLDRGLAHFRDPKVFWYEPARAWRMVIAIPDRHLVGIYGSANLLEWAHLSDFGGLGVTGGIWECPDLFELPVDGDPTRTKWVLLVSIDGGAVAGGSGMQYFVGDFDGTTFTADADSPTHPSPARGAHWVDYGRDHYAGVTYNNVPGDRRVMVGWMGSWQYAAAVPTYPWRGQMALPRELSLVSTPGGPRLAQQAVPEVAARFASNTSQAWLGSERPSLAFDEAALIIVDLDLGAASKAGLAVRSGDGREVTQVTVARSSPPAGHGPKLVVDRTRSSSLEIHPELASAEAAPLSSMVTRLQVYVDRSSIEVFAQEGQRVVTDLIFPSGGQRIVELLSTGGMPAVLHATVTPLFH
jgi:sucrose-6-phosphate hydrolase SacC (GH32 family)